MTWRGRDEAVGSHQTAAWTIDALTLYVNAFCLETSLLDRHADKEEWAVPDVSAACRLVFGK